VLKQPREVRKVGYLLEHFAVLKGITERRARKDVGHALVMFREIA
jgi:hypothetical protein